MENKLTIVYCTKDKDKRPDYVEHLRSTSGCECEVMAISNPDGISLSWIYNKTMDECSTDIIVFVHDDIEFMKKGWGKEILRMFNENPEYGVIGVAGSAQFDQNAAWWNYKKKFGQVLHRKDGNSWLTPFSPLLEQDLQEVVVIDGLFMAINKQRAHNCFDKELLGFNFYDINFCLANYREKTCKIGVTTNIRIAHNSVGELKENWYSNKEIINERYKDLYPIDILR